MALSPPMQWENVDAAEVVGMGTLFVSQSVHMTCRSILAFAVAGWVSCLHYMEMTAFCRLANL